MVYLEKKTSQAKRDRIVAAIVSAVSIIIAVVGVINNVSGLGFLVFLSIYGIYLVEHNTKQSKVWAKELGRMNRIIPNPPCLNCGKELPNKNFEFCPFCGKSNKY